jgi:hypothetical protein
MCLAGEDCAGWLLEAHIYPAERIHECLREQDQMMSAPHQLLQAVLK